MNPDYDYSIYTKLKVISLVNRRADDDQPFAYFIPSFASRCHQNISNATLRSEFLYNQQGPYDVVYQELALVHHQRYPAEKQYTHVEDAFRILHQMFKINDKKLGESSLYLATVRYLALAYKQLYGDKTAESMSKSQFAVILPMFLEKDEKFIEDILRPLFMEAGWISESDSRSKLIFFGKLEAYLYDEQQRQQLGKMKFGYELPKIVREKRYMCCLVQRDIHDDSLMLTLDIIQMRFDKDFVAASRSSISSSRAQILTPQFMVPSKTIPIQNWISAKTLQLPRFLLSRIFAGSSNIISFAHGDLYGFYLNSEYRDKWYWLELVRELLFPYDQKDAYNINECVDINIISRSRLWKYLDQEEKDNLAAIRYSELVEFFPSIDMYSVLDEIRMYAKEHKLILHSADDIMAIADVYDHRDRYGIIDLCIEYQLMHIYKAISSLTKTKKFPKPYANYFIQDFRIGVVFKITAMIELSNKLKEPIVLRSKPKHCNLKPVHDVDKTREQTILERLPGYSFYVEAKITRKQQIKLYLHQVIETQNGKEKSTLPIADTTIDIGDMYDTISDVLWSASQEYSSSECASSLSSYSHYCNLVSKLPALLEKMFQSEISKKEDIRNLQNIHIGGTECSCCVLISHKMVLDMGVKHYLNSIARSIIGCIRSPATFGKYKAQTIIITGSLLSNWTKLNNTLYRDFIWKQLEEELCLSLYQHQMKVHLIMSHADVELFPDERLIKWEKYQQVAGEKRFLVDIEGFNVSGELYEDKDDRYELVPCIKVDGKDRWRLHLIQNDATPLGQSGISSRYYLNPSREYSSDKFYEIGFEINVYVCSSQNEQDLLGLSITLKDEAFMVLQTYLNSICDDLDFRPTTIHGADFPITFDLKPENHHLKTRFSLESGCFDVNTALFSERITLKEIPS